MKEAPTRRRIPSPGRKGENPWIARRFNEAREEEARRIARVLHNESAQLLTTVQFALDEAIRDLPQEFRGRLLEVSQLLQRVEEQLRHLSHELAPEVLAELGLEEAVRYLAKGCSARFGIPVAVSYHVSTRLSKAVETAVYRIVQEAVANACRHAQPSRVDVQIEEAGHELHVVIRDDGAGFDVATVMARGRAQGLGLQSMIERSESLEGKIQFNSVQGKGATVAVAIRLRRPGKSRAAAAGQVC